MDAPTEHRVRSNAYLRGGSPAKALKEADLGLSKSPKDAALLIMRGKALFELKRLPESRQAYQKAVSAQPELEARALTEAYLGLAIVAMRLREFKVARKHFSKLASINPKDANARINLARVCMQLNDLKCAVEQGEEAGRLRGGAEDVLFTLGRIYTVAKKYPEAEKTFQHICKVIPMAASCPYGVALVAAQKGDKKRAYAKLREALSRKLPNPDKLASDPLLAPLKDDDAFKQLIANKR